MPILFAGEDVASDCLPVVEADVVFPLGGGCARRGVAKQKAAAVAFKRGRTIECLLWAPSLDSLRGSSERTHRHSNDGERLCRGLLVKVPVPANWARYLLVLTMISRRNWEQHASPLAKKIIRDICSARNSSMKTIGRPLQPWFDKTWKPGEFELVN